MDPVWQDELELDREQELLDALLVLLRGLGGPAPAALVDAVLAGSDPRPLALLPTALPRQRSGSPC